MRYLNFLDNTMICSFPIEEKFQREKPAYMQELAEKLSIFWQNKALKIVKLVLEEHHAPV